MLSKYAKHTVPIFVVSCIGMWLFFSQKASPILIDRFEAISVLGVLSAFLVIALLVERGVEVVISYAFDPTTNAIRANAKKQISKLHAHNETTQAAMNMAVTPHERLEILGKELTSDSIQIKKQAEDTYSKSQEELHLLKTPKTIAAIAVSLLLGLSICISGFRVLHSLACAFGSDACTPTPETTLFEITDVLIGALLIAGGAQGIHNLIKRFVGNDHSIDKPLKLDNPKNTAQAIMK